MSHRRCNLVQREFLLNKNHLDQKYLGLKLYLSVSLKLQEKVQKIIKLQRKLVPEMLTQDLIVSSPLPKNENLFLVPIEVFSLL